MSIASGDNPIHHDLPLFIIQLVIIIVLSRALAFLFRYVKQPQVIAEVVTGILLGPSVMGYIPHYLDHIFPSTSMTVISVVANIGLIFFMFLIGVELDPNLLRTNAKSSLIIAVVSMAVPFGAGALLSLLLYNVAVDPSVPLSSFLLFVGVAMSITAFPVLARILTESKLMMSKVGLIALSSAAVNDVVAWILLAAVVSIARAQSSLDALYTFLMMFAYFCIMFFGVRRLLVRMTRRIHESEKMRHQMVVFIFLMILVSSWVTEIIGIHAIFGGFVMGIITPRDNGFAVYLTERIEDIIVVLLLPLYFTYSGLRTRLGTLNTAESWGLCVLVIVVTTAAKIGGTVGATRLLGNTWRESFTVGVLMNTKGLVELIVLNLGLDVGVLTPQLFTIFVMMALVTTMITSPLVHVLWTRYETKKITSQTSADTKFSVLMCIADQNVGVAMTNVAATLRFSKKSKKKFIVRGLHLNEITERPSTYFFSHAKGKTNFLELVRERARALDMPVKLLELSTSDVADDIAHLARAKRTDLVILGWNEPVFGHGGGKVKQVLSHIDTTVAVLVPRQGLRDLVGPVTRVLVPYTGDQYQRDALKLARRMLQGKVKVEDGGDKVHGSVEVTVLTCLGEQEVQSHSTDSPQFRYLHSEHPLSDCIAESKKGYDLMLIGVDREWQVDHEENLMKVSDLISMSQISILLVHQNIGPRSTRKLSEISEEKNRLFLYGEDALKPKAKGNDEEAARDDASIALDGVATQNTEESSGQDQTGRNAAGAGQVAGQGSDGIQIVLDNP